MQKILKTNLDLYRDHWKKTSDITKGILRRFFTGRFRGFRSKSFVAVEYDKEWSVLPNVWKLDSHPGHVLLADGRRALWRSIDIKKYVLQNLKATINGIRPTSVIELGSGSGINVIALAVMCPEVREWVGVDMVKKGVDLANALLSNPPVEALMYLTGEPMDICYRRIKDAKITFVQGDMTNLKDFGARHFDLAFTNNSIEQLPKTFPAAFREARRIAKYAVFVEAFLEAQRNIRCWLYLVSRDYFRESLRVVEQAGFRVVSFEPLVTKKYTNGFLQCM